MRINTMTAGLNINMKQDASVLNGVAARMLSKEILQSSVAAGSVLQMLPKAGINDLGGLLDVRA